MKLSEYGSAEYYQRLMAYGYTVEHGIKSTEDLVAACQIIYDAIPLPELGTLVKVATIAEYIEKYDEFKPSIESISQAARLLGMHYGRFAKHLRLLDDYGFILPPLDERSLPLVIFHKRIYMESLMLKERVEKDRARKELAKKAHDKIQG